MHNFILNYRIGKNSPLWFRIILFFVLIYSLVLPFHFFEPIEGKIGYTFFCFIYIDDKVIYEEWSIIFNLFYYWGIIAPIAIYVSSFQFKASCVFIINFIYLYLGLIGLFAVDYRWAGESVKFILLFFHPCYVIIPIILHILAHLIFRKYKKRNIGKCSTNNTITIYNQNGYNNTTYKITII